MNPTRKIRVLVVDDSSLVRKLLTDVLSKDPSIEVVGTAVDPYAARDKILALQPDVLTLDIEMPRMDGLSFLRILMQHHPLPIVIVSSLTQEGSAKAMEAMQMGAVDVLAKPTFYSIGDIGEQLIEKIKAAAIAKIRLGHSSSSQPVPLVASHQGYHSRQVVVVGASTGGTQALKELLSSLPDNLPGFCVVQHIPAHFSKTFAERLNAVCSMEVREAMDGDRVQPGRVLIAPGGFHMLLQRLGDSYHVQLKQGPLVHHQRPSVDVLFNSAAESAREHALAVLLTGMGRDGAEGMKRMKQNGARSIVQDEASCVIYGMPRAAVELGVADYIVSLETMPQTILNLLGEPRGRVGQT